MPELARRVVGYVWEQWAYTDYFYEQQPPELDALSGVSGLANRAVATALGEFIVEQLSQSARHSEAQDYFDAAWITQLRPGSCEYVVLEQSLWSGPWDGALRAAMLIVNDAVFDAEEDLLFAMRSAWALNLARHICPDQERGQLDAWIAAFIGRLQRHHKAVTPAASSIFDTHFSFGRPVDPDLFLIDRPYDEIQAVTRLRAHEADISPVNSFYHPPGPPPEADRL
jgi:hypothetical protein